MNQFELTTLLAQGAAEIASTFMSFVDFEKELETGIKMMEAVSATSGVSAADARKIYEKGFPKIKDDIAACAAETAQTEIAAAVNEAEMEQKAHRARLADLKAIHEGLLQTLAEYHERGLAELKIKEVLEFYTTSHQELVERVERYQSDSLEIVRAKHWMTLANCFNKHFVGAEIANKLADLYEVKS